MPSGRCRPSTGDILTPRRLRPIGTPLYASVQVRKVALEARFVLVPGDTVDAGHRSPFQLAERPAEQVEGNMVKECREPNRLVPSCGRTYAGPVRGIRFPSSASGTCCPGPRALAPPLPSITSAAAGAALFNDFLGTMGESDFPWPYVNGLRVRLPDADRPGWTSKTASQRISRFPCRWLPRVREVSDHAGSGGARHGGPAHVAFRLSPQRRHPGP